MANESSQGQLVNAQDAQGSVQGSTSTEQKALDPTFEPLTGSEKDTSHDVQAALDRLQFLEDGHKELMSLVNKHMGHRAHNDQREPPSETKEIRIAPKCEIARISNAEWRARQLNDPYEGTNYGLLTVAPKERGDSGSRNQAVESQPGPSPGSGEPASVVSTLGNKNTSEKPYRAILNGGAELMETLGGIFNTHPAPGFYFWFWPFKHLIDHGEKLRARLSEEESKLKDTNQKFDFGALPSGAEEAEKVNQKHDSMSMVQKTSTVSQVQADPVEDPKSEHKSPERKASLEAIQVATESEHNDVDCEIKANSSQAGEETGGVKMENSSQFVKPDTRTVADIRLRNELSCLVTFMDSDLKDIFSMQEDIDNGTRKLIAFDHLWQLYKPGHIVVSGKGQKRAYVVLHVTGGRALQRNSQLVTANENVAEGYDAQLRKEREAYSAKYAKASPFVIDCFYLDFDGTNFGPLPQKFMLQEFDGEVAITSLEVFPIKFDDDPKKTEKSLARRGRKFVKLASVDHKYYSGRTLREPKILEIPGEVHGEIIVDFALAIDHFRANVFQWDLRFGTGVIANPTPPDNREFKGYYSIANPESNPTMFMDEGYDNELRADFLEKTSLLKERQYQEKLPGEALILLPPRVYGFSLLDRRWFAFDISLVEDIKNSNQGFDQLVIPEDHKKIMQAVVRHHTKGTGIATVETKETDHKFSMDIIRGKGKGLIILLHGVPGVGKTSTAECVAAQTGRPLFPITCGDIGSTAEQVEFRLNNYFDMAHKWGCVLLLDEADVFLARREKGGDLQRNGIVSVFLRVLEYYSGILILTTNRIGEFDEAFSSRVHIKLYYPKLDRKSTLEIWKMNIRRVAESEEIGVDVNEDEVKKFARRQWADSAENPTQRWNGRQIRNAFQSAIALARWDHQENGEDADTRPCLSVKQFEVVAKTSAHFDSYITKMHGIDEGDTWETIAARDHLRKNETPRRPASRLVPTSTRTRAAGRSGAKVEAFEDDEEGDETDTDEDEEQMKKLEDKLKKLKAKKQSTPDKKLKNTRMESSKKPVTPEVETGDSSSSSEEDQD